MDPLTYEQMLHVLSGFAGMFVGVITLWVFLDW